MEGGIKGRGYQIHGEHEGVQSLKLDLENHELLPENREMGVCWLSKASYSNGTSGKFTDNHYLKLRLFQAMMEEGPVQ